jgi:hypothetical protein
MVLLLRSLIRGPSDELCNLVNHQDARRMPYHIKIIEIAHLLLSKSETGASLCFAY